MQCQLLLLGMFSLAQFLFPLPAFSVPFGRLQRVFNLWDAPGPEPGSIGNGRFCWEHPSFPAAAAPGRDPSGSGGAGALPAQGWPGGCSVFVSPWRSLGEAEVG